MQADGTRSRGRHPGAEIAALLRIHIPVESPRCAPARGDRINCALPLLPSASRVSAAPLLIWLPGDFQPLRPRRGKVRSGSRRGRRAKAELAETIDFLRNREILAASAGGRRAASSCRAPRNRQTLLARAAANERRCLSFCPSPLELSGEVRRLCADAVAASSRARANSRPASSSRQITRSGAAAAAAPTRPRPTRPYAHPNCSSDGRFAHLKRRRHPPRPTARTSSPCPDAPGPFRREITSTRANLRGRAQILKVHARKVNSKRPELPGSRAARPASPAQTSPTFSTRPPSPPPATARRRSAAGTSSTRATKS